MPITLLFLTFGILFIENLAVRRNLEYIDWREAFLRSAIIWGTWLALITEGLSLLKLLTPSIVAVCWSLAGTGALVLGWRTGWLPRGWKRLISDRHRLDRETVLALAGFGVILALLLLVALLAAPNNKDSLQYHLSRVVHWAQNHSLQHYPTVFDPQLWSPVWAEEAILHLRLLWGNDKLANLVQWLSMLGCLLGVSLIAAELGARKRGQFATAAFALSLPMGILQSTSTQNDYVVAFWLVCLAYFTLLSARQPLDKLETLYLALALGLGMLTKGTAYPYMIPFVIWYFLARFNFHLGSDIFRRVVLLAGVVLILNGPYWLRNISTFGGPFGLHDWVASHTTSNLKPGAWVISLARNTLQNFPTHNEQINDGMVTNLEKFQKLLGVGGSDFHLVWGWNYEDTAGNPLHVVLGILSLITLLFIYRHTNTQKLLIFAGVVLASYGMLALIITTDLYGIRYQLPFWICWAPVFGVTLSLVSDKRLIVWVTAGLLVASLPWVFFNRIRPLISMRPIRERLTIPCYLGCTATGSILVEEPYTIMMASQLEYREPYRALAQTIEESGCRSIGLRIDSHDAEYPFWYIVDAPQSGFRLESIYTNSYLEKYIDSTFKPCAIICTICYDAAEQLRGLSYTKTFGDVRLYQGWNYQPEAVKDLETDEIHPSW